MVKGAPKCRICKETHFGVCGPVHDTRGVAVSELEQLESTISISIARGTQLFLDAGAALEKIRDGKLYRDGYKTFEEYCQARWGFTRQRAYQLISGAVVVGSLPTSGLQKPTNERQARELVKVAKRVSPEAAAEAWEKAGDKPTSESIRAAVQPPLEATYEIEQRCGHIYVCSKCGAPLAKGA